MVTLYVEIRLIDTFPHYGELTPPEVISLASFGSFSPANFMDMVRELGREEVSKRVEDINLGGVVRGYASLTTSVYTLWYVRGSRLMDYYFTAYPFGSYIVLSQRYVPVDKVVAPESVRRVAEEQLKVYKELQEMGIRREEARSVLGMGSTETQAILVLPLDAVASMLKVYRTHPYIEEVLKQMAETLLSSDVSSIFKAALSSPAVGGPFPNIFGDEKIDPPDDVRIVSESWSGSYDTVEKYTMLLNQLKRVENWEDLVENAKELAITGYDPHEYSVTVEMPVHLSLFNELKRHRTIPMKVESVYRAVERDRFFIYPSIRNNERALSLHEYILGLFRDAREEVDVHDLIYITPQSLIVGVRMTLSLHQFLVPTLFYRIRTCDTAETSMKMLVRSLPHKLIKQTKYPEYWEKLYPLLVKNGMALSKCIVGACPERKWCPLIYAVRKDYSDELHKEINRSRKDYYKSVPARYAR